MRGRHVVVVDDEYSYGRLWRRRLEPMGAKVTAFTSPLASLGFFEHADVDLALIDVRMAELGGVKLCGLIQQRPDPPPVILITSLDAEELLDVASVGAGTPILSKTLDMGFIIDAMRGLLRSPAGMIRVDAITGRLKVGGRVVTGLPRVPLALLAALLRHPKGASRAELLAEVWPENDNPNVVDVNMRRLRKLLAAFPDVRVEATGNGYRLVVSVRPPDKL